MRAGNLCFINIKARYYSRLNKPREILLIAVAVVAKVLIFAL
jgi:hypothetical protein